MTLKEVIIQWLEKKACKHQWKLHKVSNIYGDGSTLPHTIRHTLICNNCGKIKKIIT